MKYIVINFKGGGKIKIPANILKSIDVPDDFTVNKEVEDDNNRIHIADGCYIDSDTEELTIGIEVYKYKNENTPTPNGEYTLYENIDIEIPSGVYGFTVEDGKVSELLAEE